MACVAWVGWNFYAAGVLPQLGADASLGDALRRIGFSAPIYAVAVVTLGMAWASLQNAFVPNIPAVPSVSAYLVTQVYKYLPGGVFQYVGRHVMLKKLGMLHTPLALCAIVEAACLVAVAVVFSASFSSHIDPRFHPMQVRMYVVVSLCAATVAMGVLHRRMRWVRIRVPVFRVRWLLVAMSLYAIFFSLMALALTTVLPAAIAVRMPFTTWAALAAASWIAGFAVIGAPAGLGVRETVLVVLLAGVAAKPMVLLIAASFRLATFAGDLAACAGGLLLNRFRGRHDALRARKPAG